MTGKHNCVLHVCLDMRSFDEAMDAAIRRLEVWSSALLEAIGESRRLSRPGRIAFNVATCLGFTDSSVLAWLETCPGAWADEFGEGWKS